MPSFSHLSEAEGIRTDKSDSRARHPKFRARGEGEILGGIFKYRNPSMQGEFCLFGNIGLVNSSSWVEWSWCMWGRILGGRIWGLAGEVEALGCGLSRTLSRISILVEPLGSVGLSDEVAEGDVEELVRAAGLAEE